MAQVGIAFHPAILPWLDAQPSAVEGVEIVAERFFGSAQGLARALRARYPLTIRTRRASLLSPSGDEAPFAPVAAFVRELGARWICDHLGLRYASGLDLGGPCPAPLDRSALERAADRVVRIMDDCGARFLARNLASPLAVNASMREAEFLNELCTRTGAGVSLDLTALLVNARNHRFDAHGWLHALDRTHVTQVLAGGCRLREGRWNDTHDAPIDAELWDLLGRTLGGLAIDTITLEWEARFPPSRVLSQTLQRLAALVRGHEPAVAGA